MIGDFKPYLLKSTDLGRTLDSRSPANLPARGTVYAMIDDPWIRTCCSPAPSSGSSSRATAASSGRGCAAACRRSRCAISRMQKRENDLVVGTFGRGIYILDDLGALRAATPAVLAQEAALLPVRRAPLYVQSNPFAAGIDGLGGERHLRRAESALRRDVHLHAARREIRTRRAQRQAAERTAARRGGDVFYPSWDSLRVEDREEAPAILLTVSDARERRAAAHRPDDRGGAARDLGSTGTPARRRRARPPRRRRRGRRAARRRGGPVRAAGHLQRRAGEARRWRGDAARPAAAVRGLRLDGHARRGRRRCSRSSSRSSSCSAPGRGELAGRRAVHARPGAGAGGRRDASAGAPLATGGADARAASCATCASR